MALHPLVVGDVPAESAGRLRDCVIVLGMHRSGTSALTRVLNLLGVDLGANLLPAAEDNETGFWEHRDLVLVNEAVLQCVGSRWDDARPIARQRFAGVTLQPLRKRARAILERDFHDSRIWGMKDPRLCRLLPFWLPLLEEFDSTPRFVLPVRHPLEVAASLRRRNGFGATKCADLWLAHMLEAERETRGYSRAFLDWDGLLREAAAAIRRVATEIGLLEDACEHAAPAIEKFLDPSLRHHRHAVAAGAMRLTEEVEEAAEILSEAAKGGALDFQRLDALAARFTQHVAHRKEDLVSIIIVARNGIDLTRACLDSIARHTSETHEVIVIDNGSTDGTRDFLRDRSASDARLRCVVNETNRGFAAANNQGFAIARGNVLVVLNNDTVVAKDWLTRMLAVLDEFPDAGIVGPRTNRASGPQVVSASYRTHAEMESFARGLARAHSGQSVEGRRLVAFCWAMRRSLLEKIGGFDESFGLGNCEDDDFCLRAVQVGFRTRIVLDAFVHHAGSQTFRSENIDYEKTLRANFEIFKKKWGMDSAARPEDGYPFLELAAKALRPPVPLPDAATIRTGDPSQSTANAAAAHDTPQSSNNRLKLQAGLLPGAEPRPALRDLFRKAGHDGPLPVFASTAALNAELNRADLLLIAAGDVELTAATLRELAEILHANPEIGAVGPVSNAAPLPQKVEGNYKDLDRGLERFATKQQERHGRTWRDVTHLGAFALLLRGEAVRQVGGLRPDLPISQSLFECYPRLRSAGYHVACAPGVYLHHSKLTEEEGALFDEYSQEVTAPS
jgi:hypothetical protein